MWILWETIYGVVYLPLEGCRKNHILGFIMGTYTAAVSTAIKPLVGLYDFIVSVADVREREIKEIYFCLCIFCVK